MAASAIGLIVIMGTTQSFIQQRISFLALEKRIQRLETNRRGADGRQRIMGRDWDCLKTLEKIKLLNTAPFTATNKGFPIPAVNDSAGNPVWNFAKASGKLTDPATKARLKSHGIDKFERLDFFYKEGPPKTGRIVLSSKTNLPGLLEGKNPDIVWELSGITVEAKTAADDGFTETGKYVTACGPAAAAFANPPCGGAAGAFHTNPDGSKGGFVATTANVESTAFIGPEAAVCGNAKVKDSARIEDSARINSHVEIKDSAKVYGSARIDGQTPTLADPGPLSIHGNAEIYGNTQVSGGLQVYGNAKIYGSAQVSGDESGVKIYGSAQIYGNAKVNQSLIYGNARIYGEAEVSNSWKVRGNVLIYDAARVTGSSLKDRAMVYGRAQVKNSAISGDAVIGGNARANSVDFCKGSVFSGSVMNTPPPGPDHSYSHGCDPRSSF